MSNAKLADVTGLTTPNRSHGVSIALAVVLVLSACSTQTDIGGGNSDPAAPPADPSAVPSVGETVPPTAERPPPSERDQPDPQPYIPADPPGSADAYRDLVGRLDQVVPAELRAEVPWPDLRNPDPVVAQLDIFELWIWMAANLPDPRLVEAIAAPGSPSREEITGVFGRMDRDRVLETRIGQGYEAFDHLVVTFETAGLPLWLARDVPEEAVVVYYADSSGPVEVTDRDTGAFVESQPGVGVRAWLSIMVPTDVGWQLWRDQLIEPNDAELEVPDIPPPPGANDDQRTPEV